MNYIFLYINDLSHWHSTAGDDGVVELVMEDDSTDESIIEEDLENKDSLFDLEVGLVVDEEPTEEMPNEDWNIL